jgi:hypothetical protein
MLDFMNLLDEFGLDPKSKALAEEEKKLAEEEKKASAALSEEASEAEEAADEDMQDIPVSLNVWGVEMTVALGTLTFAQDSNLSEMFDDGFDANPDMKRDDQGRIFLDYDGDLFAIVISYLRLCMLRGADGTEMSRVMGARTPLEAGCVPRGKAAAFNALLEDLGLHDFVHQNGGIAGNEEREEARGMLADLHMSRMRRMERERMRDRNRTTRQ